MGNCLVTKLKGVVQNDMLPVLGRQAFEFSTAQEVEMDYFGDSFVGAVTAYLRGNAYFIDSNGNNLGKSTTTGFAKIHAMPGTIYLDIPYNTLLSNGSDGYKGLCFRNGWTIPSFDNIKNCFNGEVVFYGLSLQNCLKDGNLSDIDALYIIQIWGSLVTGNITDLKHYSNIISLINNPNITGVLEDLLNRFATEINTDVVFEFENPNVSYGGVMGAQFYHTVHFNGDGTWNIVS